MADVQAESGATCPFCKSDPEALADAHGEGWRLGREEGRRNAQDQLREAALAGRSATLDPGSFVKRGRDDDGDYERLDKWQARALAVALDRISPPAKPTPDDRPGGE